jgi:hypothetical protein
LLIFQTFYFYYNEFFFYNEIPQWIPFGFYGVQSDYFLIVLLSPSGYLAGLIGWLLNIKNVLFLFELSLFLEQLILLFGTYLLAQNLFKHKTTTVFVCVTVICSTVLLSRLGVRTYLYLPLVIYYIISFFSKYKLQYLLIAINIFVVSFFGLQPYNIPIPTLAVSIIFLALLFANYKKCRHFLDLSREDIFLSSVFFLTSLVLIGTYYYYIIHAMDFTEGIYYGRDPLTMKTDLNTFLTYGRITIGFEKFGTLFYPAVKFILSDVILYVGLLPLAFIIYGFVFIRNSIFTAFTCVVIIFGLLSLGDMTPVAELLYNYFPMMDYYRQIGTVVSIYKLFLPLLAGFGLDHFLNRPDLLQDKKTGVLSMAAKKKIVLAEIILACLVIFGNLVYTKSILYLVPTVLYLAIITTALILMFLFILRRYYQPREHFSIFLISCVCFQMLSYQALVSGAFYLLTEQRGNRPLKTSSIMVNKYDFEEKRNKYWPNKRTMETLPFVFKSGVAYTIAYSFLQWDPCISRARIDFLNSNVASLIDLKGGVDTSVRRFPGVVGYGELILQDDDRDFLPIMGCFSPKLKLFSNVIFSDNLNESAKIIENARGLDKLLVLNRVPEELRSYWTGSNLIESNGSGGEIKVLDFRANEMVLEARIPEGRGSWLYYADAWHPGWHAIVNGEIIPIAQANIAFKAIFLEKGTNKVRFVYNNKRSKITGHFLIIFGLIFMFVLLAGMVLKLKI